MSEPTADRPAANVTLALDILADCLNDEEPWPEEKLVERMEAVFLALGGKIEEGEARV